MTFASLIYRALKACDGPDDLGQIISFYHVWKNFENVELEDLQIVERVKDMVEVVRCENCTESDPMKDKVYCGAFGVNNKLNGYCNYGIPKHSKMQNWKE